MKSSMKVSKENNKENESAKPNPIIENIKSRYILSILKYTYFSFLFKSI